MANLFSQHYVMLALDIGGKAGQPLIAFDRWMHFELERIPLANGPADEIRLRRVTGATCRLCSLDKPVPVDAILGEWHGASPLRPDLHQGPNLIGIARRSRFVSP
ncbi:hypothetical protein GCM10010187_65840 [Actinomadura coerulea]|nr:hypothetical protein GCM10010187_65840 [Actinomadura coerulea]